MPGSQKQVRILIAEDEEPLRNLIKLSLLAKNYEVITAIDGQEALEKYRSEQPIDLIILDIMMPRKDGLIVLKEIRRTSDVPVVFLTALGTSDDIVKGFELGADDYITKPFTFREVTVRIDAILRRIAWMEQSAKDTNIIKAGDIEIDGEYHKVTVRNEDCKVTPIEFELLRYLVLHPNQPISKDELFREVWGYEFEGSTNLVEVGIRRLRAKIELDPSDPQYIQTIRAIGYLFQPNSIHDKS